MKSTDLKPGISRQDIRLNYAFMLIDAIGYPLGISFFSMTTILPMFLRQLTSSNVLIGMIPAIYNLGVFLPQVLIAPRVSRLRLTKYYIVLVGLGERLPILFIALSAWLWGSSDKPLLLFLFFAFFVIFSFSTGFNFPAYYSLLSKALPSELRGSLFGLGGAVGGLLGILGASLAGKFLTTYPFPVGYVLCFVIGFVVLLVSLFPLGAVREYPQEARLDPKGIVEFLRELPGILRKDRHFTTFVASQVLWAIGMMAQGFFTIYAINELSATPSDVAAFTGITMGVNVVSSLILGYLADRQGHKRVLELSAFLGGLGALIAICASNVPIMWVVFALTTISMAGYGISSGNIVLDFVPAEEVPTYVSLSGIATVPFRSLAPILGGSLATAWGYWPVFLISGVASFLAWGVLMRSVPEPRGRTRPG
ncbi:MAG TPA: MFS transporter [Firmicutes bacterium]|nr:MFS transporter [Bacillota bacterium]